MIQGGPLGQGLKDVLLAVPQRIELSGHGTRWQVTAGSFDSAVEYATTRFGEVAVVDRWEHTRWWRRVTVVVTTDPAEISRVVDERALHIVTQQPDPGPELPPALEAIFARQEAVRAERRAVLPAERFTPRERHLTLATTIPPQRDGSRAVDGAGHERPDEVGDLGVRAEPDVAAAGDVVDELAEDSEA